MLTVATHRRFEVEVPRRSDEPAIAQLFGRPMGRKILLSLHRGAASRSDGVVRSHAVVVRDTANGMIVGYGSREVRRLHIDGREVLVGYLGSFRTRPQVGPLRRALAAAYEHLLSTRCDDEAPFDLTAILADNHVARRLFERGLPGLPPYHAIEQLVTLTLAARPVRALPAGVRMARTSDEGAIAQLLSVRDVQYRGRPAASAGDVSHDRIIVEHGGAVVACARVVFPEDSARITVAGYAPTIQRCRGMINIGCALTGRPALPPAGRRLEIAFVKDLALSTDDRRDLRRLIDGASACAARGGAALLAIGVPETHPLAARRWRRRAWVTRSTLYAVGEAPKSKFDRAWWPEVATL